MTTQGFTVKVGHSPDVELLEVVMPGNFATEEVSAVDGA
jgi:hypothetical protein